ncbi:MAG: MFS transporter [Candidatus Thorarchaeota archaeon]|nr:MFS transporter [Candidatus Thorarchaeota archaeon]
MSEDSQDIDQYLELGKNNRGGVLTVLNLSSVTFCVLLGLNMVAPILPTYAESFQVSYTLVGFVISSFAITRMFLDMPAGVLSKRYDKKKIMITGLILIVISSILAGMAPSYIILVIARMIEGAGSAFYVTSATVFLAQISGKEKRGQWMSLYMGMLLLGSIFGPTFGGVLADIYDIHAPFFAYALVAGFGIVPTLLLPRLSNSEKATTTDEFRTYESTESRTVFQDIRQILSYRSYLLATFATFSLFFIRTGVRSTLVPLFGSNNLGLDSTAIGVVLTLAGVATAITMVPMGSISDRIGRRAPLVLCLLLTALITITIPYSSDMGGLSLSLIIYGAFTGISGPMAAYVTDLSPQDKIEISMGLYRMIGDFGFVLGPLFLGYIADITAIPVVGAEHSGLIGMIPFAVASILLLLASLLLLKADDPVRKKITIEKEVVSWEDSS